MTLRYDESIPTLIETTIAIFGSTMIEKSLIVRDAGGRLTMILGEEVGLERIETAGVSIVQALGAYVREDRPIADLIAPGSEKLLEEAKLKAFQVTEHGVTCKLLDRRIVGADWLRPPITSAPGVPRLVFASLKGGVGRSTALCVIAAHLSRRGLRVLAIDFDLEAPGIGSMLLSEEELPNYGTLDYFVESGISGIDDEFINELSGDSFLGASGGRVTVIPAIGKSTLEHPENALGKIARAYLEDVRPDGSIHTMSEKLNELVDRFESTGAYDIVLVDARAGLHESTAAAILGIGGTTLMFGVDQPQTFLGYRLLMAHLAKFSVDTEEDWRDQLYFVHAKASDAADKQNEAAERFAELYDEIVPKSREVYDAELDLNADDFSLDWLPAEGLDEFEGVFSPPPILYILDESRYRDFNPVMDRGLLLSDTYSVTFRSLLDYVDTITTKTMDVL